MTVGELKEAVGQRLAEFPMIIGSIDQLIRIWYAVPHQSTREPYGVEWAAENLSEDADILDITDNTSLYCDVADMQSRYADY